MTSGDLPDPIAEVGRELRRLRLPLGVDDYDALRRTLAAGFGWSSREELCRLCVALWAKSPEEAEIVRAAFSRSGLAKLDLGYEVEAVPDMSATDPAALPMSQDADQSDEQMPQVVPVGDFSAVPPPIGAVDQTLVLVPQYPLTEREIAQAWRRLRRWRRSGPAVELNVVATLEQYSHYGIATPPVLVPRRRNTARLLLMIDRFGSMTPFHGYVDHVVGAIRNAGRIDDVRVVYFHDLPGGAADRAVLDQIDDPFRTDLDSILPLIEPMRDGSVYEDPDLTLPYQLGSVLEDLAEGTSTVIISDGGAARQRYDATRLLDTVALLKALRTRAVTVMWLNPMPWDAWPCTTAADVRRYIPMYPLTRQGLDRAIDGLRGRPASVERLL